MPQQDEVDLMMGVGILVRFNNLPSTASTFFSYARIDFDSDEGMGMTNINSCNIEDMISQNDHIV